MGQPQRPRHCRRRVQPLCRASWRPLRLPTSLSPAHSPHPLFPARRTPCCPQRNPFRALAAGATLLDVLELLGNKNLKRVPIVDVASGKIEKLITQGSLTKFLLEQPRALDALDGRASQRPPWVTLAVLALLTTAAHDPAAPPPASVTVNDVKLGMHKVIATTMEAPALRAFELMTKHDIRSEHKGARRRGNMPLQGLTCPASSHRNSAVGITSADEPKTLLAVLSDTDMRNMIKLENFQIYGVSVRFEHGHCAPVHVDPC